MDNKMEHKGTQTMTNKKPPMKPTSEILEEISRRIDNQTKTLRSIYIQTDLMFDRLIEVKRAIFSIERQKQRDEERPPAGAIVMAAALLIVVFCLGFYAGKSS